MMFSLVTSVSGVNIGVLPKVRRLNTVKFLSIFLPFSRKKDRNCGFSLSEIPHILSDCNTLFQIFQKKCQKTGIFTELSDNYAQFLPRALKYLNRLCLFRHHIRRLGKRIGCVIVLFLQRSVGDVHFV